MLYVNESDLEQIHAGYQFYVEDRVDVIKYS